MTHRIRMARKRLMVAREREAKALAKERIATAAYFELPEEAPAGDVWAEMYSQGKASRDWIRESYALRAIERRKDRLT